MSPFTTRRDQLRQSIRAEGLDAILVTNPINVTYLTGFTGDASYLILEKTKTLLVSDGRFKVQLSEECPGLDAFIRGPAQSTVDATIEQLKAMAPRSIGFESSHLSVAEFQKFATGLKTSAW